MGGPRLADQGEFKRMGVDNNITSYTRVISMARSMSPYSAGSQFFIMHQIHRILMSICSVRACIEGLETVDAIASD
jgi:peptidyl-prolyl cis-trans isomerase B (cyclophilin B)